MAKGTLLSIVFLIVGAELLPEPCEANLSFELPLRLPRSPEPKCPGCSSRHSSDCGSKKHSYSHSHKVIVVRDPYVLPQQPNPYPAYYPTSNAYDSPSASAPSYNYHMSPSYEMPAPSSSSYDLPSPPSPSYESSNAVSSYEPQAPSYSPAPSSYESHAPLPSSYSAPMPSYHSPPPAPSYGVAPPAAQAAYSSVKPMSAPYGPPPMSYPPAQPAMSYEAPAPYSPALAPPLPPPAPYAQSLPAPAMEAPAYGPAVEQPRYSPQLESPGCKGPSYAPAEPSHYGQAPAPGPCYPQSPPASYSSYEPSYHEEDEYHPVYATRGLAAAAEAEYQYQHDNADHGEAAAYSKYKKRSEPSVPKMDRAPILHRNFRPYERERRSGNYNWPREARDKLFVVYRSDAGDEDMSNQDSHDQGVDSEVQSEVQSAVRRAFEIAKRQREQETAMARHAQQQQLLHRYHYDQSQPDKPYSWQTDLKPLLEAPAQQEAGQPQRLEVASSDELPDARLLEMARLEFDENDGDDVDDPAWQPGEWSTVPSLPFGNLEQQPGVAYDRALLAAPATVSTSPDRQDGKLDVQEISRDHGESAMAEGKETKTERPEDAVVVIEDMEMPMTFTEPTSFENPILSTTAVA